MTTFTADRQARKLAEIEARTKRAWESYSESVRDLKGHDYEDAESESWEQLQDELKRLDDERGAVEAS